jgi:hypothetical protein
VPLPELELRLQTGDDQRNPPALAMLQRRFQSVNTLASIIGTRRMRRMNGLGAARLGRCPKLVEQVEQSSSRLAAPKNNGPLIWNASTPAGSRARWPGTAAESPSSSA